jgi:cytochrome c
VTSLAISPDGARIAAGTVGNGVAIAARTERKLQLRLGATGWPVWAVAFRAKGKELLTGGGDGAIRRWDAETGAPIEQTPAADTAKLAEAKDDRGAEVFQACAACHSLTAEGGNRAGPSLHGLFGRRIATAAGYNFSEALKKLDIVWNAVTISALFEIGPSRYTPGTKMPEQVISDAGDRAALVKFLESATKPR